MNKKVGFFISIMLICSFIVCGCSSQKTVTNEDGKGIVYKDGTYEGKSEKTIEGYYGKAEIIVKRGKITSVDFQIFDRSGVVFDEKYGPATFVGNDTYIQQCEDDLEGIKQYKEILLSTQDVDQVDTITGATWSNQIFKETINDAIKNAVK